MKHLFFFLLSLSLLSASCGSDDDIDTAVVNDLIQADLHYDAVNFSAPLLPAGIHTAAVRFTDAELNEFSGQSLSEIIFFIQEVPSSTILSIRGQGTDSTPGDVIYSANIGDTVGPNGWNLHVLPSPILIDEKDLWVCLEVVHNGSIRSVGCDAEPANVDADWISSSTNGDNWETLRNYTDNEVDINWNIRARVSN